MDENECLSKLISQLKSAYRKYKTHIYYDNYSAIQRIKLANFELSNFDDKKFTSDFDLEFHTFFKDFAERLVDDFENEVSCILNKIDVISVPKSFFSSNQDKIISNYNETSYDVNKIHYFIDLPIEGHILGVLWILRCGYLLDDKLYDHCYGNRLNETLLSLLKEEHDEWSDFSPFLFKPYYKNYQSWRDNGLNSVNSILNNNQNVLMLSLDFKDYYYRSLIDFDDLKKDINKIKENISDNNNKFDQEFDKNLNNFIEDVFKNYSNKFYRKIENKPLFKKNISIKSENYKNLPMIPLGFLPSLIIANWNLQGFDQAILEDVHPFYYGRYVDDILIVLGSHKKSDSFGKQHLEELNLTNFLKKYFTPNDENPFTYILHYVSSNDNEENVSSNNDGENNQDILRVYNLPLFKEDPNSFYHYENLEIQKNKVKVYKFSHECSDSIIKNFKKEIYKNSSEFRLMHTVDYIADSLEDNIYKIDYEESINKLNGIKDVKINKFEISKLLSRLNHTSKNMYGEYIGDELISKVKSAFNGKNLEFMILWEKLFSFLYINGKNRDLIEFVKDILNDINLIEFCVGLDSKKGDIKDENIKETLKEKCSNNNYNFFLYSKNIEKEEYFDSTLEIKNLKRSLSYFLYSSLVRTLALKNRNINFIELKEIFKNFECFISEKNWGMDILEEIGLEERMKSNIISYLFSSMQNNSLMKYPLQNTLDLCKNYDNKDYDLIKPNNKCCKLFHGIYPRFIKFNEFVFFNINNEIFYNENNSNNEQISKLTNYSSSNNSSENEVMEESESVDSYLNDDSSEGVMNNESDDSPKEEEKNHFEKYIYCSMKMYNKLNFNINSNNHLFDKIKSKCYACENCQFDNIDKFDNIDNVKILNIQSNKKDSIKVGLINTQLFEENFISRLKNNPNLSYKRFDGIKKIINESIEKNVELLLMPEMYVPYEWIDDIVKISKDHQMGIIFGVEPILNNGKVGNYIMATLPFLVSNKYYESLLIYRIKNYYANNELNEFKKYDKKPIEYDKSKYHLLIWHDIYIAPYYCFEIADIHDRSIFKSCCDIVTVSEFNRDTLYFNNIAESLSRDLFCYCIKANTSEFGGTSIVQPSSSEIKYLVNLKGGDDDYIVTHELDIKKLREDAIKNDNYSNDSYFKPKPPGFEKSNVKNKMGFN